MSSIHLSIFLNCLNPHGGTKRSRQLECRGQENGLLVMAIPSGRELFVYALKNPILWISSLPSIVRLIPYVKIKGLVLGFTFSLWLRNLIKKQNAHELHVEVGSGKYLIFAYLAVNTPITTIAYPHNIEFMVPGSDIGIFRSKVSAQVIELAIYRRASLVKVISDIDAFILKCFSIYNVQAYPYIPVTTDAIWLQELKEERVLNDKSGFLILGSVTNLPTQSGILELLGMIRDFPKTKEFYLAGFGTESLQYMVSSNLTIYGSVSNAQLRELMLKCEGLLIKQSPTSGMLTRIVDALCAGIPVYIFKEYIQAFTICSSSLIIISSLDDLP